MKRYLLFIYNVHEPAGGWHDLEGTYDNLTEAQDVARRQHEKNKFIAWHLYDLKTCQLILCRDNYGY